MRHPRRLENKRLPYYPNQEDINDLIRKMALTKSDVDFLISGWKQWDLLDDSVRITFQRKGIVAFQRFSLLGMICATAMI